MSEKNKLELTSVGMVVVRCNCGLDFIKSSDDSTNTCRTCHERLLARYADPIMSTIDAYKTTSPPLKDNDDPVNHPKHYNSHASGIECITIARHMNFNLGNTLKYIWRADLKNGLEDLKKAVWYINNEINRRENLK